MGIELLFLFLGLVTLIFGGELLVRGSSSIALKLHISPLVVGLTIVAFGTSAPELFISIKSALSGSPDLTMGNVIGSNICNLALVLGLTAVISPIHVNSSSIRVDWPMTMGSSLLLYFLIREGLVSSWEGVLFITILVIYTFLIIRKSRKDTKAKNAVDGVVAVKHSSKRYFIDIGLIALGGAGLYFGSEWFVDSAIYMAGEIGVSERVIGITVVAIGTSLPELATAIIASIKKETDLALGNLMGSNIFNILSILGITSLIQEIQVSDDIINIDLFWMLGITLIILPMMLYDKQLSRIEGALLLCIYCFYTYIVIFT